MQVNLLVNINVFASKCICLAVDVYIRKEGCKMTSGDTSDSISTCIKSLTIVSIAAIISIMICCLASLGYNSKITVEKEKIEVTANNSNLST